MTGALANLRPGIWIAFNSLRTLTIGVGIVIGFALGTYALEFGTTLGMVSALGSLVLLIIAMWLIWRPGANLGSSNPDEDLVCESRRWLQKQIRLRNVRRRLSVIGAFFGASLILLISFAVFVGGSPIAGLLFFCSGAMAMRVAWTLVGVRRSTGGGES